MKTMNTTFARYILSLIWLQMATAAMAGSFRLVISNPLDMQRQELAEVPVDSVYARLGVAAGTPFEVLDAMGLPADYQISHDGLLLVDAAVRPCGRTVFTVRTGVPAPMHRWVDGRVYPERKDDLGWENDRGMYRVYGPALQRTGERSYGIDVWTKNSKELQMAERYDMVLRRHVKGAPLDSTGQPVRTDYEHSTFHLDHGDGLDCYAVGPSLGCGAPALMEADSLVLPYCYETYRILDDGPLRFAVELTYGRSRVGLDTVREHRVISLDKGSNFCRMVVWYEGLTQPRDVAAGVVVHTADTTGVVIGPRYVHYADPTDQPAHYGHQLYVAALFPEGQVGTCRLAQLRPARGIAGHAVGIRRGLRAGERFGYYFGSAWSSYDVRTQAEWQLRIDEFLRARSMEMEWSMEP